MQINKSGFDRLINENYEGFIIWRNSSEWDEQYKWNTLQYLSQDLSQFSKANTENVEEIIHLYQRAQSGPGSFVHFSFFDNLLKALQADHAIEVAGMFNELWAEDTNDSIYAADDIYKSLTGKTMGTPAVGYILAGRTPEVWPLYRGEFWEGLKADFPEFKQIVTIESQYLTYASTALYLGKKLHEKLVQNSDNLAGFYATHPAISGQDFLYHLYFGRNRTRILDTLEDFVKQADQATDLAYGKYSFQYLGLKVRASFGQGTLAKVPWLGFNVKDESIGFRPTYFYFREIKKLVLSYDHAQDEQFHYNDWAGIDDVQTIEDYCAQYNFVPPKYGSSKVFKAYDDPFNLPTTSVDDLEEILNEFKAQRENILNHPKNVTIGNEGATTMQHGLNKIYYGPPGTGKTYRAVNKVC